MAIAIRSVTTNSNNGSSATIAVTTSESPSATQVGDLVVVFHSNTWYTMASLVTPTATGSPTLTPIPGGSVDGGTNLRHVKSYTYVANTGGAQTISSTHTGTADEEKVLAVYVLSGADTSTPVDVAQGTDVATSTTWVLTGVTASSSDAYLIAHLMPEAFKTGTWTAPGSMTEQYDASFGSSNYTGAIEQLSASGDTGTRTFTSTSNPAGVGVLVAIQTDGGGGGSADSNQATMRPLVGPYPRLLRTGVLAPLQLRGDRAVSAAASVSLSDTAAAADALAVAAAVPLTDTAAASDALTLSAAAPLADTAAASDLLTPAAAVPLSDTSTAADTAAVEVAAPLVDTASADDALSLDKGTDQHQFVPGRAPMFFDLGRAQQLSGDRSGPNTASVTLSDTATGDDSATVTAAVLLTEAATGDDALSVSVALTVADTATADDLLSVQVAGGTDPHQAGPQVAWMFTAPSAASFQLRGSVAAEASTTPSLSDTAAGDDTLTAVVAAPIADTATGTDALTAAAAVPLTETATGTDALAVTVINPLDESATATDSLLVVVAGEPDSYQARALPFPSFAAPFIEPHAKPLQLQGEASGPVSAALTETATATDALTISVAVSLSETAAGSDALSTAVAVPLTELVAASEALSMAVVLAVSETATATDSLLVNTGGGIRGRGHGATSSSSPGNVYPPNRVAGGTAYPFSSGSIIGEVS